MAWNYRKRVKVAPGVYVNISKKGVSTTVGVRGASVSFGKNGTYVNTGIPGTGFYQRRKICAGQPGHQPTMAPQKTKKPASAGAYIFTAIFCFMVAVVSIFGIGGGIGWGVGIFLLLGTWANLSNYKTYYGKATTESDTPPYIESTKQALLNCADPTKKKILKNFVDCYELIDLIEDEETIVAQLELKPEKHAEHLERHKDKLSSLKAQLEGLQYDVDKELADEEQSVFEHMCSSFEELINSHKVWRITNAEQNSQVKSSAGTVVERVDGNVFVGVFNYLRSNYDIPVIDLGGRLLYLYPKFALLVASPSDFDVVSYASLSISTCMTRFNENGTRPMDAELIGNTWKYVNKNGDPDKRFADNPRIPVLAYGSVVIECPAGTVTIMFSNHHAVADFGDAFMQFKRTISVDQQQNHALDSASNDIDLSELNFDSLLLDAAQLVIEQQNGSTSHLQRRFLIGYNRAGRIMEQLETLGIISSYSASQPRRVLVTNMQEVIQRINEYRLGTKAQPKTKAEKPIQRKSSGHTLKKLEKLIGLNNAKTEIISIYNLINIQKKREEQGMKSSSVSYHCVFAGNPGTGKTTVARLVAEIYKELGILKKGHLVETDRSGLVAEYVGQTAVKTNKIIDSALDGVLFIDEAYSLVQGGANDFGMEAISTLLKRMEDDCERLVVILAGYSDEMKTFIDSNPGLQSRFNRYIHFEDYSAEELAQIFELKCKSNDYQLMSDAKAKLMDVLTAAVANKDQNFGNARYVRNLFEKTLEKQAIRLAAETNITKEVLAEIKPEDLPE